MTKLTQYWHRPEPPPEIAALMAGYRRTNPTLRHQCFSRESAEAFIQAHFSAREVAAFRCCAVPAMQADYFRYCAVLAMGGFYVDADTRCGAPLEGLLGDGGQGVIFRRDNGNVINGCFGFRDPGHPLLSAALEIATTGIERRLSQSVWVTTGPGIFTYLHMLSLMSPAQRLHLDYDHIDPDATAGARLCRDVAQAGPIGLDQLFDGVRVADFESLGEYCLDVDAPYKSTGEHWPNWQGSIFS